MKTLNYKFNLYNLIYVYILYPSLSITSLPDTFLPKKNLHIKKTKKLYGVTVKINKFILFFLFFLKNQKLL